MTGGALVETDEEAGRFSRTLGRPVAVGELLAEEPCVPAHYLGWFQENKKRMCPRVELELDNVQAASLAFVVLQPQLAVMFSRLFDAGYEGRPPEERLAAANRIANAVTDPVVTEALTEAQRQRRGR